jgi:hypothetical protein
VPSRTLAFARFLLDLRRLPRAKISAEDAGRRLEDALAHREDNFLEVVRELIYANPASPYRLLLGEAGCEFGDIERSVRANGLDAALLELREADVYVGFEEFKGRTPVVRNGRELPITPEDFDNPSAARSMRGRSGGSTGRPMAVFIDVDAQIDEGIVRACTDTALGFHLLPRACWWEMLPSPIGIQVFMRYAASGLRTAHWYAPPNRYPLLTRAKHRFVTEATVFPLYHIGEAGCIGVACANPVSPNDLHFCRHAFALLPYPRVVPHTSATVNTFHITTLLPSSPKIMLNVETDDYGVFETRSCGCPLEDLGFTEHVREVFSFSKLTGEGVTLVGSDAIRILEEVLPSRVGGTPLDYQLHEEEDADGRTRLSLVVSPRIAVSNEADVVEAFLGALGQSGIGGSVQSIWRDAGSVRVKRAEPTTTLGGKLLPLMRATTEGKDAR